MMTNNYYPLKVKEIVSRPNEAEETTDSTIEEPFVETIKYINERNKFIGCVRLSNRLQTILPESYVLSKMQAY